jgi:hypothetical protein
MQARTSMFYVCTKAQNEISLEPISKRHTEYVQEMGLMLSKA